jgi:uncharacterized protein YjbI with pentapeptide repeats
MESGESAITGSFRNANPNGIEFAKANLSDVDFRNANLNRANLHGKPHSGKSA